MCKPKQDPTADQRKVIAGFLVEWGYSKTLDNLTNLGVDETLAEWTMNDIIRDGEIGSLEDLGSIPCYVAWNGYDKCYEIVHDMGHTSLDCPHDTTVYHALYERMHDECPPCYDDYDYDQEW